MSEVLWFTADTWSCSDDATQNVIINTQIPDIDAGLTALFVYCNLVTPSCVDETCVRLLRAVTVPHGSNQIKVKCELKHTHF